METKTIHFHILFADENYVWFKRHTAFPVRMWRIVLIQCSDKVPTGRGQKFTIQRNVKRPQATGGNCCEFYM